jgi:hypothetical protein
MKRNPCCGTCGAEILGDFTYYGITAKDIVKMVNWLKCQNATIKDLECSSLNRHYWERVKVMDILSEDFR